MTLVDFDHFVDDSATIFFNNSINATAYLWTFGDGNESTLNNPTHYYDNSGEYEVQLIASNDYCSDTLFKTIDVSLVTGIGDSLFIESVILYPNPNLGNFELELRANNFQGELSLQLWDISGKQIDERVIIFNGFHNERYEQDDLTQGLYLLQISNGAEKIVIKVEILGDEDNR